MKQVSLPDLFRKLLINTSVKVLERSQESYDSGVPSSQATYWYQSVPVRNPAARQEMSGGVNSEASSAAAPHPSPSLALPPEPSPLPSVEKLSSI